MIYLPLVQPHGWVQPDVALALASGDEARLALENVILLC